MSRIIFFQTWILLLPTFIIYSCDKSSLTPLRVVTELKKDEPMDLKLSNEDIVKLSLIEINEVLDSVHGALRAAYVKISIDGEEISIDSGWHATNDLITTIPLKFMPPHNNDLQKIDKIRSDYNYMITRYADALLMYAGALIVLGQKAAAAGYVNQLRERVDMAPIIAADLNIDSILHERRIEFDFEWHRYWGLVRTGKAIEYIPSNLMSNVDYEFRVLRS